MAREALTVIGTVIGAFYGKPQLGYAIGAFVGGLVDPEQINAPSIGDIANQTSAEGVPCPLIAGTAGCAGNLIYASDPRVVKGRFRSGKGGPEVQDPDRVYRTFAIRIGASLFDGPGARLGVTGLRKIWEDEKLVYDVSPESVILEESAAFAQQFTFYQGTETQLPDPDIEAIKGVGNVPAYRGRCYIVFKNKDVTDRRGSISQYRFEVTVNGESFSPVTLLTDSDSYSGPSTALLAGPSVGFDSVVDGVELSPNGQYAIGGDLNDGPSSLIHLAKYVAATESWQEIALPDLPAAFPSGFAWSPDSLSLAIAFLGYRYPWIWRRSGDVFTLQPVPSEDQWIEASSVQVASTICFDSVGQRIATSTASSLDGVYVWDYANGVISGRRNLAFPGTNDIGGGTLRLEFQEGAGSRYLFGGTPTHIYAVRCEETPMEVAVTEAVDGRGGVFWDASGGYAIAVGNGVVSIYAFAESVVDAESFTFESSLTTGLPTDTNDADISVDRLTLAIAPATGPDLFPTLVALTDATPPVASVITDPPAVSEAVRSVSWTGRAVIDQFEAGTTTFEAVVLAAGRRCKLPDSAWSIANQATKVVRGSVVASQNYTAQDYINSLRLVFPCDGAVYDGLIHLPSRGGAVDRELDEQFMVWEGDDLEQEETLRNGDDKRVAPIRRPLKINLMFPNAKVGYQLTKATSPNYGDRADAVNESTLEIPIVLDEETEAPQLADILDKISRADAEGEIVRVFPENLAADLVPGSVVRLLGDQGLTRRLRVESTRVGDCTKRLLMRVDRVHANLSQITSQPGQEWPTPPPSLPGDTAFVAMNLPALLDGNDTIGVYIAISGYPDTAWNGAFIDYRQQGATAWQSLGLFTRAAVMGAVVNAVPAASEFYPDTTNVVMVNPIDPADEIESLTDAEWLSEGNPCAIVYPDGRAEVFQPRDASQDSDGAWSLSHLQRGRLATTPGPHSAGATFVQLEGATFVPLPSSLMGQVIEFRVTTAGKSTETAETYLLDWDPVVCQTEFPIADLSLALVDGFIDASWSPRFRLGTEDNPVASTNLTGYRFEASDGATTKVTDPVLGTTHSVNASFFAGSVTVTVRPINRFTGLGPAIARTIDI